jgi:hypothetical protein
MVAEEGEIQAATELGPVDGASLVSVLGRTGNHLLTFSPEDPSDEPLWHEKLVRALARIARRGTPVMIAQIDGEAAGLSPLSKIFARHGFTPTSRGYLNRGAEPAEDFARHA